MNLTRSFCAFAVASLAATLATAAVSERRINTEAANAVRAAKTVRLVVEQSFKHDVTNAKPEEAQQYAEGLRELRLGFDSTAARFLAFAGVNAGTDAADARVVVTVKAVGEALSASYRGYNLGGRLFSGAALSGAISVAHDGVIVGEYPFARVVSPPSQISTDYPSPRDAPFYHVFPAFERVMMRVICDMHGTKPLAAALRDLNWQVQSAAAWALGQSGRGDAVPLLIPALRDGNHLAARRRGRWATWETRRRCRR